MEDDGIDARPYRIAVDMVVQGDEIIADFGRSDAQAKGAINATLGVTCSATYNAMLHLTDPSIPRNSGCYRPIRVLARPASVVNVDFPAPEVGGNTETHVRICYTVIAAMSRCLPERAFATDAGTHGNFLFGGVDPENDEYYVCYDFMVGGWGGRPFADGNNTCNLINGNCRTVPVEVYGEPLSLAHRDSVADRGFGRRRQVSGRARLDQDAGMQDGRDHHQLHGRPSQERPLGPLRRRFRGIGRAAHQEGERERMAGRLRGLRQGLAQQVRQRLGAARRPGVPALGRRRRLRARWPSDRKSWWTRTWPRVSSPPQRPPSTTAWQSRRRTRWGERKPKFANRAQFAVKRGTLTSQKRACSIGYSADRRRTYEPNNNHNLLQQFNRTPPVKLSMALLQSPAIW